MSDFKGGTCCPECGLRQSHLHVGWIVLPDFGTPIRSDGVLMTSVTCEKCAVTSLIVRVFPKQKEVGWVHDHYNAFKEAMP